MDKQCGEVGKVEGLMEAGGRVGLPYFHKIITTRLPRSRGLGLKYLLCATNTILGLFKTCATS